MALRVLNARYEFWRPGVSGNVNNKDLLGGCPALNKQAVTVFPCRDFRNTTVCLSAALLNCN